MKRRQKLYHDFNYIKVRSLFWVARHAAEALDGRRVEDGQQSGLAFT